MSGPRRQPCPAGTTQGLGCQLPRGHAGQHTFVLNPTTMGANDRWWDSAAGKWRYPDELSGAERETLLTPCICGHDLNDHGSLAGCRACGEVEADPDCPVTCEALIVERVGLIVAGREALAWDRGWDERDGYCSEPYSPPRDNPYRREARP